jgi:hypothetical protein
MMVRHANVGSQDVTLPKIGTTNPALRRLPSISARLIKRKRVASGSLARKLSTLGRRRK